MLLKKILFLSSMPKLTYWEKQITFSPSQKKKKKNTQDWQIVVKKFNQYFMSSFTWPQPRVVEVIQLELLCNKPLSNFLLGAITLSVDLRCDSRHRCNYVCVYLPWHCCIAIITSMLDSSTFWLLAKELYTIQQSHLWERASPTQSTIFNLISAQVLKSVWTFFSFLGCSSAEKVLSCLH